MYTIVGLGNPGKEYEKNRHNVGRIVLERLAKTLGFEDWKKSKVHESLIAKGNIGDEDVTLLLPEKFMNRSGVAVKKMAGSPKKISQLIVVHDDIDLPVGALRIVQNRGTGGHKGVASIVSAVKSKAFTRIRVGVVPVTPTGKPKKPKGDTEVQDFVLGEFKKKEWERVDARIDDSVSALQVLIHEGVESAMQKYNQ